MPNAPIARRDLIGRREEGLPFDTSVRIGAPYEVNDVSWACPVAVDGIDRSLADQHGVDSWQALILAISLARSRLEHFIETGGKLYWRNDPSIEVNLGDIFGNDT